MEMVGVTPRVVGNEQEGMHDEAKNVVDASGGREGTVSSLMSYMVNHSQ